jgi:hypothetical protein
MDFDFRPVFAFFAIVGVLAGAVLIKLLELIVEHVRIQ